jgi:hypothetical protein
MDVHVDFDHVHGVRRLRLRATTLEGPAARRAAEAVERAARHPEALIVDLGPLRHADSGLWIGIVRAGMALRDAGTDLKLCGGSADAQRLLFSLELHRAFDVLPHAYACAARVAREHDASVSCRVAS